MKFIKQIIYYYLLDRLFRSAQPLTTTTLPKPNQILAASLVLQSHF